MIAFIISVVYVLVWRMGVLACGLIAIILGYKLFKLGLTSDEGRLEAGLGSHKIKISNIAPGTFFALFGAVIIAALVWTSPTEIIIPKDALQPSGHLDMSGGGIKVRPGE